MREKIKGILYATAKEDYGKVAAAIEIALKEEGYEKPKVHHDRIKMFLQDISEHLNYAYDILQGDVDTEEVEEYIQSACKVIEQFQSELSGKREKAREAAKDEK